MRERDRVPADISGKAGGKREVSHESSRASSSSFTLAEAAARGLLSVDLLARRLTKLREAVPEAFTEGSVDWEMLRHLVGATSPAEHPPANETTPDNESTPTAPTPAEQPTAPTEPLYQPFGLFWAGMRGAEAAVVSRTSECLRPQPALSIDWQQTQNVFIEGENLATLKLLNHSYWGSVKMIYIDPPYNTGKDFIYSDRFASSTADYLRASGQTDAAGKPYSTNKESAGRFHSNWLSMIYPRLVLARDLLRADGVIFISINDNEVHHLRMLCDKVFGDENFITQFVWQTKQAARGVPTKTLLIPNHEYILCYGKDKESFCFRGEDRNEEDFHNPDNDVRGLWRSESMKSTVPNSDNVFSIINPKNNKSYEGTWAFSLGRIEKMIEENLIIFPNGERGVPRQKKFITSYRNEQKAIVSNLGWFSTENATKSLMNMFDGKKIMDFPKPVDLIKELVEQSTKDDDLILDFFAGSCTTAHAVMQLNAEDGGRRRFVLTQIDEPTPADSDARQAGYKTIADIGRERIRRAAQKIKTDFATKNITEEKKLDLGFKSFKLDSSNFKIWEHDPAKIPDLQKALAEHVDRRIKGREKQDFLFEILLKYGYQLTAKIEQQTIAQHECYLIDKQDEAATGRLLLCLEDSITDSLLDALEDMDIPPRHIVMFDHAFTNNASLRANFYYCMKNKAHETQQDITVTTL